MTTTTFHSQDIKKPHVLVFCNEKGGTGKSTLAVHVTVSLLHQGYTVGSIDLDERQATLSRYWENRKRVHPTLQVPHHIHFSRSHNPSTPLAFEEDKEEFYKALLSFNGYDYVVVDTPGADSLLIREVLCSADTLITPLNDSFIDLDLLVRIENPKEQNPRPSFYAELVWEQRKIRAFRSNQRLGWIVVRNRVGAAKAKNKEYMETILMLLAKKLGFVLSKGFGERVIFRELFLAGATLLDVEAQKTGGLALSHVAARQELRNLMGLIPKVSS